MFQAIGNDSQGQCLRGSKSLFAGSSIDDYSGQDRDVRDPSTVIFTFKLDLQIECR
jgi:hypothetical protein